MNKFMKKIIATSATSFVMMSSSVGAVEARVANTKETTTAHCNNYVEMARASLPGEVGNTTYADRLLSVKITYPQLSTNYNRERTLAVLGDTSMPVKLQTHCPVGNVDDDGEEISCGETGMKISFDAFRGKMKYLNPARSYLANKGINNPVGKNDAMQITLSQMAEIGVPHEQFHPAVDVKTLIAAGRDDRNKGTPTRLVAEQHVLLQRQVQDVPVFDSYAKAAISAEKNIARLRISWPDFHLQRGLSSKYFLPHSMVSDSLSTELTDRDSSCELFTDLKSYIAYVPTQALMESFSAVESEETAEDFEESTGFVPALVVYAYPREPKEDSGEVSSPGQQFVMPLFGNR